MTIQEAVIQQGIASDAAYAGCLARDLRDVRYAAVRSLVALCMAPYLSLFLYESHCKLEGTDPVLASLLSSDVHSIVERSRHSLKLFDDTHRGIDGQIAYFRDDIVPAHRGYFIDRLDPSIQQYAKDLGLFSYSKKMLTTSHGATFHMSIGAGQQLAVSGSEMQAVYEEYGHCFRRLGAQMDSVAPTFISSLDPQLVGPLGDDVRAESYYADVFDGANNLYLNAVLTVFRGMMNFVNSAIPMGTDAGSINYTEFKIRFLTLYAVLGSLLRLENEQHNLTDRSVSFIDRITGTTEAQLILARSAKPFRNTLMHYNLNSQVDLSRVNLDQPLFGLVPIYFPTYDVMAFVAMVDRCIAEVTEAMEAWAGQVIHAVR